MCGIFGFSFKQGATTPVDRALLANNLAIFNDTRGGDSWGIVGILNNQPVISRGLGKLARKAHKLTGYNTLFAHTRWATNGDITEANAHPFEIGNIIGAHNGMIFNHTDLNRQYNREFEVDSQHLIAHINEDKPIRELVGYGAVEWIEKEDPRNIFISKMRNGSLGVVGVVKNEEVVGIVWSSSIQHLVMALSASGIHNCFRYRVKTGRIYSVKNGSISYIHRKRMILSAPVENGVLNYSTTIKEADFKLFKSVYAANDSDGVLN